MAFVWGVVVIKGAEGARFRNVRPKGWMLSCKQWGALKGVYIVYLLCSAAVLSRMPGGEGRG